MDIALAVIGGTGVYRLAALEDEQALHCDTPYGAPSGPLRIGHLGNARVAFLARHGEGHALPPHRVNYRANLHALQQAGVRRVLALNTVGGITEGYGPRVLACPDQIIDYTWGRESTYWDGEGEALHKLFSDTILVTAKGRHVRPKTLGQRVYLEAIRRNSITFGIGPAGTGKTYLAVVMAVAALRTSRVPPAKAKSGMSRPLPSASAATPRCWIGTSSRCMNQIARPNSTSARPSWAITYAKLEPNVRRTCGTSTSMPRRR